MLHTRVPLIKAESKIYLKKSNGEITTAEDADSECILVSLDISIDGPEHSGKEWFSSCNLQSRFSNYRSHRNHANAITWYWPHLYASEGVSEGEGNVIWMGVIIFTTRSRDYVMHIPEVSPLMV